MDLITLSLAVKQALRELGVDVETKSQTLVKTAQYSFLEMGTDWPGMSVTTLDTFDASLVSAGDFVSVSVDGAAYKCKVFEVEGAKGFGNASLADGSEDTGEPFVFDSGSNMFLLNGATGSHTVGVVLVTETIHPIDPKYLPKITVDMDALGVPIGLFGNLPETPIPDDLIEKAVKAKEHTEPLFFVFGAGEDETSTWFDRVVKMEYVGSAKTALSSNNDTSMYFIGVLDGSGMVTMEIRLQGKTVKTNCIQF